MTDEMHEPEPDLDRSETGDATEASEPRAWHPALWPSIVAVVSLLAIPDAYSLSRTFYVRDASFLYLPIHRWFRATVLSGGSPLWDPYVGYGQPAIADATRQILFPPVVLARLLLPETLGFNLSVALGFPVAALGAYLLLRRRVDAAAAALGALVFTLSGPVLSTGNMLNHEWALALAPWVVWSAERAASSRRAAHVGALALAVALQALAGEPVTLAVTCAIAVAWGALCGAAPNATWPTRIAGFVAAIGGTVAGGLLAAIQLLPLADAVGRSSRAAVGAGQVLPLHPLSLAETVAWPLYGTPFNWWPETDPWLAAMNDGNDPYYYSLYVGAAALAIATAGGFARSHRRAALFWIAILVVSILCALGPHTFVYPSLQQAIPALEVFRYPAKYAAFAALGLGALAAFAWDEIASGVISHAAVVAGATVAAVLGTVALVAIASGDGALAGLGASLAAREGIGDGARAGLQFAAGVGEAAPRLLAVAGVGALALAYAGTQRPIARAMRWALFALVLADPFTINSAVNPALDAGLLARPAWVDATRDHPGDRVFLPGKVAYYYGPRSESGFGQVHGPLREMTTQQTSAIINTTFASIPSEYQLRDAFSIDLTNLWPGAYRLMVSRFAVSPPEERRRYLERVGTRYFVTREDMAGATPLAAIPNFEPRLVEGSAPLGRAFVAPSAVASVPDHEAIDRLFRADFDPTREALLAGEEPAAAGDARPAAAPAAEIVAAGATEVAVRATAPEEGGYLVLTDSYEPHWHATVDGASATVVRADGLFRAVRIASGPHDVRFSYVPTPFYAGLVVTVATALGLLAWALVERRRTKRRER